MGNPCFFEFTENIPDIFQPTLINQPFSTINLQNFPITFIFFGGVHRTVQSFDCTGLETGRSTTLDHFKRPTAFGLWTVHLKRTSSFGHDRPVWMQGPSSLTVDPSHFSFEINVGKRRIRHRTTLKLNGEFLDRLQID